MSSGSSGAGIVAEGGAEEAGFPPSTVNVSRRGINRMIKAELGKLGRKYIRVGKGSDAGGAGSSGAGAADAERDYRD